MTIRITKTDYSIGGVTFDGAVVADDAGSGARPAVMICHGWEGRSDAQIEVASTLAAKGYIAFACDMFGDGIRGDLAGDNSALIAPLLADRQLLRDRLIGTTRFVQTLKGVDAGRIAAIGFCFGGLCALDLARSGIDIRAVASFHGLFGRPAGLPVVPIKAKVIACHGWDDPMVPPADVVALATELTEAGADWQLHAYGHTMHGFMARGANRPEAGIQYNARAAQRAWTALEVFLTESLAA
jgi:dienelactone hydrolase